MDEVNESFHYHDMVFLFPGRTLILGWHNRNSRQSASCGTLTRVMALENWGRGRVDRVAGVMG